MDSIAQDVLAGKVYSAPASTSTAISVRGCATQVRMKPRSRSAHRGTWTEADQLELSAGSLEATVRALVRNAIDNHSDDPQLLRIMIEEAPFFRELIDAIDRHEQTRTDQLRDLLARHPDVGVRDLDTAARLITFTVETNTHKLLAGPRTVPVETFENELVNMVTHYLRGDR